MYPKVYRGPKAPGWVRRPSGRPLDSGAETITFRAASTVQAAEAQVSSVRSGPLRRRPAPRAVRGCRNSTLTAAPRASTAARSVAPRRAAAVTAVGSPGSLRWRSSYTDGPSSRFALIAGRTAMSSVTSARATALCFTAPTLQDVEYGSWGVAARLTRTGGRAPARAVLQEGQGVHPGGPHRELAGGCVLVQAGEGPMEHGRSDPRGGDVVGGEIGEQGEAGGQVAPQPRALGQAGAVPRPQLPQQQVVLTQMCLLMGEHGCEVRRGQRPAQAAGDEDRARPSGHGDREHPRVVDLEDGARPVLPRSGAAP